MLGVNQLDFINYCNALKGNYRKGVHKMETLLENPTHAKEFAKNLGGVSVVLGTPVGKEDRNSETLRSMLLASDVANDAVYTWMGQYYEFDSWDELLGDEDRCKAMMANELLWRALSASGVAMGKTVATLAGLSCSAYDDMSAVAASSTAMTAVASSQTARTAIAASSVAMSAIASSSMATAKFAVGAAGLDPTAYADMAAVASSQTAMTAVASSQTAMAAIFRSSTALQVVQDNASAWAIFSNASSAVMGKTVAELAGLNPSSYADMNAIASSSTAMTAVAASSTAMAAVASSSTAMQALYNAADTTEPILKASSVAIDAFTAKSTTFSRKGTWRTGLNKPAFMLTMKCDYGSISSNRNFAQCGAYKLGTTRRQSDSITPNKEMPMYGWVSLVEAYFVDSNYTTTVRYITW